MKINVASADLTWLNSAIFSQVADVVWKEQFVSSNDLDIQNGDTIKCTNICAMKDKETCSLTHQTVHYSRNDLVAFAKSKFRSYKRKYIEKTDEGSHDGISDLKWSVTS